MSTFPFLLTSFSSSLSALLVALADTTSLPSVLDPNENTSNTTRMDVMVESQFPIISQLESNIFPNSTNLKNLSAHLSVPLSALLSSSSAIQSVCIQLARVLDLDAEVERAKAEERTWDQRLSVYTCHLEAMEDELWESIQDLELDLKGEEERIEGDQVVAYAQRLGNVACAAAEMMERNTSNAQPPAPQNEMFAMAMLHTANKMQMRQVVKEKELIPVVAPDVVIEKEKPKGNLFGSSRVIKK